MSLDRRTVLSVVGSLVGLVLAALFVRRVFFDLSITVRAVLILGLALALLAGAAASRGWYEELGFAAIATYLGFVGYAALQFTMPAAALVLFVFGSGVGVILVAYFLQEGRLATAPSTGRYVLLGLLLVAAVFVAVDVRASGVEYEVTLKQQVSLGDDAENATRISLGTATARTTFVFREPVSFPNAGACIYTGEERTRRAIVYRSGTSVFPLSVGGTDALRVNMTTVVLPEVVRAVEDPLPVERAASCPPSSDEERVVVVVDQ